jgi:hypothetical protein
LNSIRRLRRHEGRRGKAMNMSKTEKSTKGQMRAPVSFMSGDVRPSACTPLLTQRQLKIRV